MNHPTLLPRLLRLPLAGLLLLALPGCPSRPALPPVRPGPGTFVAAEQYSVRIGTDGTLWNTNGDIAPGSVPLMTDPPNGWVQVGTATGWVQVAAGSGHALALQADGRLFSWGYPQPQRMAPTSLYRARPQLLPGRYAQVAAGEYFSLALTAAGQLWAWGTNAEGQLGPGGAGAASTRPVPVPGRWAQVAAGGYHGLALSPEGQVWAWGSNDCGQLGPGVPADTAAHPRPVRVPVPGRCVQVAAGRSFSLALTAEGQLWAWGDNSAGQLGTPENTQATTQGTNPPPLPTPRRLPGRWARVAAGTAFTLALRPDGQLWAWGANNGNELGRADNADSPVPMPLPGRYSQLSAGFDHALALGRDGQLYAWGNNDQGKCGTRASPGAWGDEGQPTPAPTENQ